MATPIEWHQAYVVRVIDGDTTVLKDIETGKEFRARHIGYNTPETHHPTRGVECYGPEASNELKNLIEGKVIEYASDPVSDKVDKYHRALMHLRYNGELVSMHMIEGGLAFAYHRFPNSYQAEQIAAESAAEAANAGLWGACQVFPDSRYPGSGDRLTQQIGRSSRASTSGDGASSGVGLL